MYRRLKEKVNRNYLVMDNKRFSDTEFIKQIVFETYPEMRDKNTYSKGPLNIHD